jgi:hypothetical protein
VSDAAKQLRQHAAPLLHKKESFNPSRLRREKQSGAQ